jgi:hypothetical protein
MPFGPQWVAARVSVAGRLNNVKQTSSSIGIVSW